jgi:peptide/nickel transport system permease protein
MGFDRSLSEQYLRFITGALHLDFGRSLYTDHPVIQDIREGFPATLELVIFAGVIITLYGGLIGIASAHFADRWPDNVARMFALLAIAMPNFVWALLLMLLLSFWMGWLPIAGRLDEALLPPPMVTGLLTIDSLLAGRPDLFWDALRHIALPAIALSLPGLAQVSRITRAHLADSYARPYIEFARAYGLRESSVAFRWALRPALTPTLTVLGMQVVAMLGNAFLIETVFLWPGMARYGVQAIVRKDLNAIIGVVMVVSICFVAVNMLVDAIVALLDPRLRLRRS